MTSHGPPDHLPEGGGQARGDDRDESESERLDRNWGELLQELRITQTGLQLLSGFLLTLPFTQVFASLDQGQEAIYLCLVIIAGLAIGANMTPVVLHRRVFREGAKGRVVEVGHIMVQVVMVGIAALVTGMTLLIFSVVVSWAAGFIAAGWLAVALAVLLVVLPQRLKPE